MAARASAFRAFLSTVLAVATMLAQLPPVAHAEQAVLQDDSLIFTVTTAEDRDNGTCEPGDCSLREAIDAMHAAPGIHEIHFNIPGDPPFTIDVGSTGLGPLPSLVKAVKIDARTQPGWAVGVPVVELDGTDAGPDASGFVIEGTDTHIHGFVINRFSLWGIFLDAISSGAHIGGNFVGTDVSGKLARPNGVTDGITPQAHGGIGIFSTGGPRHLIGEATAPNVISGNAGHGIWIEGGGGHFVSSSFIGTDATAEAALGNALGGVIVRSPNNSITENVISGNGGQGIMLSTSSATGNVIQDNVVGVSAAGLPLGNVGRGIFVSNVGADSNTLITGNSLRFNVNGIETFNVGGVTIQSNLVANNAVHGIYLGSTTDSSVSANHVGVLGDGTAAGNGGHGVVVITSGPMRSGNVDLTGNLIRHNGQANVHVFEADDVTLSGNTVTNGGQHGVQVVEASSQRITVLAGSTTANAGKGISLASGANGDIQPPTITEITFGSTLIVSGTSLPSALIQIYHDPDDEGAVFLGETVADEEGFWSKDSGWTITDFSALHLAVKDGQEFIRATQTDADGNTSEFSGTVASTVLLTGVAACDGVVMPFALVQLRSGQTVLATTTAGADGSFAFTDVEPGTYTFVFIGEDGVTVCGAEVEFDGLVAETSASPSCELAANATWTGATVIGPGMVEGRICRQGQSFWVAFTVKPESLFRLRLTGPNGGPLSPDLNLFLYRDIQQEHDRPFDTKGDWTAQFAGSEFIGSEFIGSEFIGSEFIGSEFIGSEFIGSEFIGSEFIGSEFIGSEFIGSEFIGSEFIGSEFIGSEFIGSEFIGSEFIGSEFIGSEFIGFDEFDRETFLGGLDPKAFSVAVPRSLIRISINRGSATESIAHYTWERGGTYYVQVRGRHGAFSLEDTFELSLETFESACSDVDTALGVSSLTVPGPGYKTLILTHSERFHSGAATLTSALADLAAATDGHVADLAGDAALAAAYAQWDGRQLCSLAANVVTDGVKAYIESFRAANPGLEQVVFAGADHVLPFRRVNDPAKLAPEWWYVPPVQGTTNVGLRTNKILTDDFYTNRHPLVKGSYTIFLPELPTGRLVETPEEIATMVAAYLEQPVVSPSTGVVTGYSFLVDLAEDEKAQLEAAGLAVNDVATAKPLIQAEPGEPTAADAWSADDFRAAIASDPDILAINVHLTSPGTFLAADYSRFTTRDLEALAEADPALLRHAIVMATSCHSGFNIPDVHNIDTETFTTAGPDSAQAFARRGVAALLGGTGYQYGETIPGVKAYTERIHLNVLRVLREGPGPVSFGDAHVEAKLRYAADLTEIDDVHPKVMMVSTLYGVPSLMVDLGGPRLAAPSDLAAFGEADLEPVTRFPGAHPALDLRTIDVGLDFTDPAHQVQQRQITLKNLADGGATSTLATYFAVVTADSGSDGLTVANPGEPILPRFSVPLRVDSASGTFARGVVFLEGSFAETPNATPVTATPAYQLSEPVRYFLTKDPFPTVIQRLNYANGDFLLVTPAQYVSAAAATGALDTFGTWRSYTSVAVRLYYSPVLTETISTAQGTFPAALAAPPALLDHRATVSGATVSFDAFVGALPNVGVQDVFVTWIADGATSWASIALAQDPENGLRWTGELALPAGVSPSQVRYLIQAVSGTGLVSRWTNFGALFPVGEPLTAIAPKAETTTLLTPPAMPIVALRPLEVTARLVGPDGAGVAGRPLVFILGAERVTRFTDAAGFATARLLAMARPGPQQLAVSFAEDDTHLGSSATLAVAIAKETTSLELSVAPASQQYSDTVALEAILRDGLGRRLREQTVFFQIRDADGAVRRAVAAEADFNGVARATVPLDVDVGTYAVTAAFAGVVDLGDVSVDLTHPRYEGTVSAPAQLEVTPEDAEATYTGDAVRATMQDVTLSAAIAEAADGSLGDISTATATFVLFNDSTGEAGPMVEGTLTVTGDGAATASATVPAGTLTPGVYSVRVVVGGNYAGESEVAFLAIYDPDAGFVTGGGWINADPATRVGLVEKGRISFGLTWKYVAGTTIPRGSIHLQQQGGIVFRASAADWLVITSGRAELEGDGTIDGVEGYRYRVKVTDGPDGLSIRIWDASTSFTNPLYRAERTPIDNGSIRVHQ